MSLELKHDDVMWQAYLGAESFPDGTAPFFAELPSVGVFERFGNAVLILDYSDGQTTLSVNTNDEEGYTQCASKVMRGMNWDQAKAWAERHIDVDTNVLGLELLGFKLENV